MSEQGQKQPWTFCKVDAQGRAGQDGVLRYTASGKPILSVSVAINRGPKEAKRTIWLTLKAFGELAEKTQIRKGDTVQITGSLDVSSWNDKTTGQQRDRIEILADQVTVKPRNSPAAGFFGASGGQAWDDEDLPF